MTDGNGWRKLQLAEKLGHSRWYIERFRAMARDGEDLAGEARMIDAMVPRGAGRGYPFDEFLADVRDAGMTAEMLAGTWDLRPFTEASDFLIGSLTGRPWPLDLVAAIGSAEREFLSGSFAGWQRVMTCCNR